MLRQFWEIDSSGIFCVKAWTVASGKSREVNEGYYQIALPWKQETLHLPNNYRMAMNRLENLEWRLKKNPQTAAAYGEIIVNPTFWLYLWFQTFRWLPKKVRGVSFVVIFLRYFPDYPWIVSAALVWNSVSWITHSFRFSTWHSHKFTSDIHSTLM